MRRYFINLITDIEIGDQITIDGELFHHIFDVCRQQVGSKFELLNPNGDAFFSEVTAIKKKSALLTVKEKRILTKTQPPFIHLLLSFPKISTFETIIEKAVELGVTSITPIISDFSSIKSLNNFPKEKEIRWNKIILQATQQSARGDLLKLLPPKTLTQTIQDLNFKNNKNTFGIFAFEGECKMALKDYLASIKNSNENIISDIYIIVGSEGGFSQPEVQFLIEHDLNPVTLGHQVLRVETACLSLASIIKYEFVK